MPCVPPEINCLELPPGRTPFPSLGGGTGTGRAKAAAPPDPKLSVSSVRQGGHSSGAPGDTLSNKRRPQGSPGPPQGILTSMQNLLGHLIGRRPHLDERGDRMHPLLLR